MAQARYIHTSVGGGEGLVHNFSSLYHNGRGRGWYTTVSSPNHNGRGWYTTVSAPHLHTTVEGMGLVRNPSMTGEGGAGQITLCTKYVVSERIWEHCLPKLRLPQ